MPTLFQPPSGQLVPRFYPGGVWHLPTIETIPVPRIASAFAITPDTLPVHQRFNPICVLFFGRRGAGKTLAMTALGYFMHQAYIRAGGRRKILSNYHVSFADLQHPKLIDSLNAFPDWGKDSLCLIDEVAAYAPGRRSLARINVDLATFLQQVRKRAMEFFFTTQFPQVLDIQILMQIDLQVEVSLRRGGCGAQDHRYCIGMVVHDWWGQWTGNMRVRRWPPDRNDGDWGMTVHNCHKVFAMYSSDELIAPIWSRHRETIIYGQWRPGDASFIDEDSADDGTAIQGTAAPEPSERERHFLTTLLEMGKVGFTLRPQLASAQQSVPTITSVETFKDWLVAKGFTVEQRGNIWEAYIPRE